MPQDRETRLPDLLTPVTDEIAHHLSLPPLLKNRSRAQWGAFFFAWAVYVAVRFKMATGASYGDLAERLMRLPGTAADVWWPFALWGAVAALGLLWLTVGVRGYRGAPRDIMAALWSLVYGGIFAAVLWYQWYLPPEWILVNFLWQGFCWATVFSYLVIFWLALRSPSGSGNAARMVTRFIRRQAVTWRTGARRQF